MPTKLPRINITVEESANQALLAIAKREHKSLSGTVRELVLEALELREDRHLAALAEKLDKPDTKTHSHDEAWK